MKELLELGGTLLYVVFFIVTFPLVVLTQCILETWAAFKYLRSHRRPLFRKFQWRFTVSRKATKGFLLHAKAGRV